MIKKIITIPTYNECQNMNCVSCDLYSLDGCEEFRDKIIFEQNYDNPTIIHIVSPEQIKNLETRIASLEAEVKRLYEKEIERKVDSILPYTTCDNTADLCNPQHTLTTEFKSKTQPSSFVDKNTFSIYKNNGEIIKIEFA